MRRFSAVLEIYGTSVGSVSMPIPSAGRFSPLGPRGIRLVGFVSKLGPWQAS